METRKRLGSVGAQLLACEQRLYPDYAEVSKCLTDSLLSAANIANATLCQAFGDEMCDTVFAQEGWASYLKRSGQEQNENGYEIWKSKAVSLIRGSLSRRNQRLQVITATPYGYPLPRLRDRSWQYLPNERVVRPFKQFDSQDHGEVLKNQPSLEQLSREMLIDSFRRPLESHGGDQGKSEPNN